MEIRKDSFLNILRIKKNRCATGNNFKSKCYVDDNPQKVQLIEYMQK